MKFNKSISTQFPIENTVWFLYDSVIYFKHTYDWHPIAHIGYQNIMFCHIRIWPCVAIDMLHKLRAILDCATRLDCISHKALQWHHNKRDGVSIHRCLDCLLKRLLRRSSKKTSKLRVTGLCEWNPPVTGEFPYKMPVMFPFDDVIMNICWC